MYLYLIQPILTIGVGLFIFNGPNKTSGRSQGKYIEDNLLVSPPMRNAGST